jgi:hypothetical protein
VNRIRKPEVSQENLIYSALDYLEARSWSINRSTFSSYLLRAEARGIVEPHHVFSERLEHSKMNAEAL